MMHSLQKYAGLSATLLEFLVFTMEVYDPTRKETIKQVHQSNLWSDSQGSVQFIEYNARKRGN